MSPPAAARPGQALGAGLAWLGLSILCWAPMFSIGKRALAHMDAFALGTLRYALGAALFVAVLVMLEGRRALSFGPYARRAILFGVIGITGFNVLVWVGLTYTRPEHAGIIMALQSPLTALAVWAVRGERPGGFTLACVALAFAGVVMVITKGDPASAFEGGMLFGDALVLAGALAWVVYSLSGPGFAGWSPLRMTVLTCLPGAAGLAVVHLIALAAGFAVLPGVAAIGALWWQMLYFAAGSVVLGVLGFNFGVQKLGPLNAMLVLNFVPIGVFAIEAALGRDFGAVELGGAALVIGALVANNLHLRSSRRAAVP